MGILTLSALINILKIPVNGYKKSILKPVKDKLSIELPTKINTVPAAEHQRTIPGTTKSSLFTASITPIKPVPMISTEEPA